MKKLIHFVFIFCFITPTFLNAQEKLYDFESAYVKKKTTSNGSNIEIITLDEIYIYNSGKTSVTYKSEKRNIKNLNKTEESNSVVIVDGDWIITYDPKTKQGTKRKNILANKFKNLSEKDTKKMSEGMKDALNAQTKDLGNETISGKKCKITETTSNIAGLKSVSKVWTYGNFVMKMVSESMGTKVEEVVTEFNEGIKFDKSKITVPKDVKLKEVKY